jgi:ubiquitin-protein ligase
LRILLTPKGYPNYCVFFSILLQAVLDFPSDFPNAPPAMTFKSDMWHPNIYEDGKVREWRMCSFEFMAA